MQDRHTISYHILIRSDTLYHVPPEGYTLRQIYGGRCAHGTPSRLVCSRVWSQLPFYTSNAYAARPVVECVDGDCLKQHSTLFQTPKGCARCEEAACRAYNVQ